MDGCFKRWQTVYRSQTDLWWIGWQVGTNTFANTIVNTNAKQMKIQMWSNTNNTNSSSSAVGWFIDQKQISDGWSVGLLLTKSSSAAAPLDVDQPYRASGKPYIRNLSTHPSRDYLPLKPNQAQTGPKSIRWHVFTLAPYQLCGKRVWDRKAAQLCEIQPSLERRQAIYRSRLTISDPNQLPLTRGPGTPSPPLL